MDTHRILKQCLPLMHQFKGVLPVVVTSGNKPYRLADANFIHYQCIKCGAIK